MTSDNYCPRCHALLTEADEAARECTQCGEPITMKGEGDDTKTETKHERA